MFILKKQCGRIKARGCADGRKQRSYMTKEETSSPTVATESLMLSCAIDARENRDVATVDIPVAFMQADMEGEVDIKSEGKMADMFAKLNPELYSEHIRTDNVKSVLYVRLQKALYGTLQASLLFWKRLSELLKDWGFKANEYDRCVMNKTIKGKQCTILWHVDDLKISHVDAEVVTSIIDDLSQEFGKHDDLTVNRGDVHDYLGMTLDYSKKGKIQFQMFDYIDNMIKELPEGWLDGLAATPAANHLFEVNDEAAKLSETESLLYHHNTAKLLYLSKRARPDIQTSVAFMCTRVTQPDVDDLKKLQRVLRYIQLTRYLPLTLEADGDFHIIKWWVDASYGTHPDMKSHTDATMSLGKGSVYSTSTRQKLNTISSTEAELVGMADVMPMIIWTRYFLEGQGYKVTDNIVYQDNKSTMLMAKNGKASSRKRTKHIDIRYFFLADRVNSSKLTVEYCPTGDMTGDFFTKPLQGAQFINFR